jgi:hypothetical protein
MAHAMAAHFLALWQQAGTVASPMTAQQFHQHVAFEAVRQGGPPSGRGILVPLGFFAVILAIVWLALRNGQARIRARSEFHKQLLDKFGSGQEFTAFLESKGSQRFLDELWSARRGSGDRMLRMLSIGVVLSSLGVGLTFLAIFLRGQRGLIVVAVILLALGVGYLIVALITHRLSKAWAQEPQSGGTNF